MNSLKRYSYCEMQFEHSGDILIPLSEDPFHDDMGYGAAIHVVSTNVQYRLTWGILKGVMKGLWDFLVVMDRYLVGGRICGERERERRRGREGGRDDRFG